MNTTSGISLDVCQAGYSASKAALDKITIDLGSKSACISRSRPENSHGGYLDPEGTTVITNICIPERERNGR